VALLDSILWKITLEDMISGRERSYSAGRQISQEGTTVMYGRNKGV